MALIDKERLYLFERALMGLPERARKVLLLSRMEGWSYPAIAEHLGVSPGTVYNDVRLHGRVGDLNHWHQYIYYAVFLGSIAWAFAWGAARSAVHLLWLCATATMAIPLTSLAALLFPTLGMWAHGSAATIGVDVVAFIGALCFVWMAIATARRVRHGPADSIWSIRKAEDRTAAGKSIAFAAE
jgi:hypothetical protein